METRENKPMPNSPKPTDEVQLNIETVTPDTEKDVVPTKDVKQPDKKDSESGTVTPEEIESEGDAKEVTDNPKEGGTQPTDNPVHKKGEADSPSDEIETVSP